MYIKYIFMGWQVLVGYTLFVTLKSVADSGNLNGILIFR